MARPRPRPPRGVSLIELMIAMAVIAVGLLAMWNLHVVGLTSTAAGRRHTVAVGLARELLSGLERLAFTDDRLGDNEVGQGTPSGLPASALFGPLVDGGGNVRTTGGLRPVHEWDDGAAVPGVRLDGEMREAGDGGGYERRWTVWGVLSPSQAGGTPGVKLVAVSVVWRDPPFARPREVVLYSQVMNPGALASGLAANP